MIRLILAPFAIYRLAQLIALDNGPDKIFYNLRTITKEQSDIHGGRWENFDEAINCPYCLGVWFAFVTVFIVKYPTKAGDFVLYWMGLAGMQAFLQSVSKGR